MIILPNAQSQRFFYAVVAFTGVGDHGIVADDAPCHPLPAAELASIFSLGIIPIPLALQRSMSLRWSGPNARSGIAMAAWTMPEYAFGYPLPEWPLAFFDQAAYDINCTHCDNTLAHLPAVEPPFELRSEHYLCAAQ